MTLINENSIMEDSSTMNKENEDPVYLLSCTISWEDREKMCAADTSDIFKDSLTPSRRRRKSLNEGESNTTSKLPSNKENYLMQDQEQMDELFNEWKNFNEEMCASDAPNPPPVYGAYSEHTNKCHICKQVFKKLTDLRTHLDEKHSYREFCCNQCGKKFKKIHHLKKHKQIHSSERPFQCNTCTKAFKDESSLINHMFVHTKKSKYFCELCNKYFGSNSSLKIHIKSQHTAERLFKCSICSKAFVTRSKLNYHLSIHSDERPHQCSICNKSYKTRKNLRSHENVHKDREKTFPCDFCDKRFVCNSTMMAHCRQVHLEKKFKCEECGKEFVQESKLKDHHHQHNGEKPYKCETCGKCFARKDYFYIHKADHLNEKAWKCEKCNKAFKRNDHLQKHMLTHSDYKPFECDICKKTFNRKYNLKVHSKVHTEEYLQKVANRRNGTRKGKMKEKDNDINVDGMKSMESSDVPRVKRSSRKKNVVRYIEENEDEFDIFNDSHEISYSSG